MDGLRERKKARTRRELTRAALRLVASRGYEETTIADIAEAADVSPRTVFRYYASKVDAIFGDAPERFTVLRTALADRDGTSVAETTRTVLLAMAEEFEREKDVFLVRARLFLAEPAVRARWLELLAGLEREIATAAAGARPSGRREFRARLLAATLIGVLRASALTWAATEGASPLHHLVHDGFDAVEPVLADLERADRRGRARTETWQRRGRRGAER